MGIIRSQSRRSRGIRPPCSWTGHPLCQEDDSLHSKPVTPSHLLPEWLTLLGVPVPHSILDIVGAPEYFLNYDLALRVFLRLLMFYLSTYQPYTDIQKLDFSSTAFPCTLSAAFFSLLCLFILWPFFLFLPLPHSHLCPPIRIHVEARFHLCLDTLSHLTFFKKAGSLTHWPPLLSSCLHQLLLQEFSL